MIGGLRERLTRLRSGLFGAVAVLVGGTALAQLITALCLPVLTRLYSPADFSLLAVFAGLLSVLSVAACLRYEIAIPLPEGDDEAANVLAVALGICGALSAMVAVVIGLLHEPLARLIQQPALSPYLWMLAPGMLLVGSQSALQFWMIRRKRFAPVARARVAQALAGSGVQIGSAAAGWGAMGLLAGQVASAGIGSLALAWRARAEAGAMRSPISTRSIRRAIHDFARFPKYSALEALANAAGMYLPLTIVAAVAAGPEAGFLMLAMSAMQGPMALVGNAVAQVYVSHAAERHRDGDLACFTSTVLAALMRAGAGPLLFAFIVAPEAFALVFGEEWRRAGELVRWMMPWFLVQFLATPVGMALHVVSHQGVALALQIAGLALRVGAVLAAAYVAPHAISEAYSLSGFVFYSLYLWAVLRSTGSEAADMWRGLAAALPLTLVWVLGAWPALLLLEATLSWIP